MKKILLTLLIASFAVCAFAMGISAQEHNLEESCVFPNGFLKKGVYSCSCVDEGCDYSVTEEREPLFTVNGFSVPMASDEFRGISFGYQADLDNLDEYERINGSDLKYGFLISSADNYAKGNGVITRVFDRDSQTVEIKLNYGDALTGNVYSGNDVVFAGIVEENKENGETSTVYLQSTDGCERVYKNSTYGALTAVNYNYISDDFINGLHFVDACSMDDSLGTLGSYSKGNGRVACSSYIKVNEGDTICFPEGSPYIFLCYAYYYDKEINEYVYSSYIDLDPKTSSNWNYTYTFKAGVKDAKGKVFNFDNLYIRMIFKLADMSDKALYADDIKETLKFNLKSSGTDFVNLTYECDGVIKPAKARKGEMLGTLPHPQKEGYCFAGWYEKSDTTYSNQITAETFARQDMALVAKWTKATYTWKANTQVSDRDGKTEYVEQTRVTITDYIKVKAGDSISLDRNLGYKFIIYCYTGENHAYTNDSYIDCDSYQATSKLENWGHTYTFGNTITLGNGQTIKTEDTYIRIVFTANAGKQYVPITVEGVQSVVVLNFSDDEE